MPGPTPSNSEPSRLPTRLLADRRRGEDRRAIPRRHAILSLTPERRAVVDRRAGAERRSTLDRRCRPSRPYLQESPSEHVRNAMQLVRQALVDARGADAADLDAALKRLERALALLESRSTAL